MHSYTFLTTINIGYIGGSKMSLPIRTTREDALEFCKYVASKPTGVSLKDAKAVLDSRRLDGRKVSAYRFWGFIENEEGKFKVTARGRLLAKQDRNQQIQGFREAVTDIPAYLSIVERAVHRNEPELSAVDVGAHWHENFRDESSENDRILNHQAVCFFQFLEGADLGNLIAGRKGKPTRFEFNQMVCSTFLGTDYTPQTGDEKPIIDNEFNEAKTDSGNTEPTISKKDDMGDELGNAIFVAHGKNKKPLEQLKKILGKFSIPHHVAADEPNLGRPISQKVKEIMQSCNCAILIFSADEEFQTKKGEIIWRPSENVVHELGAASYLYGQRVVIMKEDRVTLPSNFHDIGYIPFEKDNLESKTMEILAELIGFNIVKISV